MAAEIKNMESITFTENELIEALINAQDISGGDNGGYLRSEEMADALGWSIKRVRCQLRKLRTAGRVEVGRVMLEDLQGRRQPVAAYRLIPQADLDIV